ncbi:hypothetical protein JYK02_05320 [Corallococcus macrosporus]|uniref:Uncharacterized protein n=1 Tax=Corallococcus macrosporus TaxID=35 RepID=A0ABS3D5I5_9BACT|nr:hypothetical protein [Corallococcus macrosporus]MBN8226928.1 hypothetical protein [Corallococcus macrosporus]
MTPVVRSRARAWVLMLSLLSVPALAQGLPGLPPPEACWNAVPDEDHDGLGDSCELQVAAAFMPTLWIAQGEKGVDRRAYFAARPLNSALRTLRIFYLDAYFEDHGIPSLGIFNVFAHDGDSEFQVLDVHYADGRWYLDQAFLSAHLETACDASGWYSYAQLEYAGEFRGAPRIYVAVNKHGAYNSKATCDRGCYFTDSCSQGRQEALDPVNRLAARNVGSLGAPLINAVTLNGQTERLLDDVEFKGWDDQAARSNSTPYRARLARFGF